MPMLKAPRQVSRRQELRRDVVVTGFARVVQWYNEFRNYLIGAGIGLLVIIFAGIGYGFYQQNQSVKAAERLGAIVRLYEQGQYRQALDGTEQQVGLLELADRFSGTDDGNLAAFYAGDALFRLGEKEQALTYFRRYDKGDDYIGASAYAGEAAVLEDQGDHERAADLYLRAVDAFPNPLTSPDYLLGAARNFEQVGDFDEARSAYERITEDYPDVPSAQAAEVFLARLETLEQD